MSTLTPELIQRYAQRPELLEAYVAQGSFVDFLSHCWLEEVGRGAIRFAMWPHIAFLARFLPIQKLVTWLKARQIGCTWLVAAYVVWKAQYHPSEVILLLSRREVDAKVFLRKCLFIYNNLPPHLRVSLVKETTDEMEFASEDGNSRIIAMPSSPDVGRSYAVSAVVADEADFQAYFDQNFAALTPTIEAGGQFIALSTSNPYLVDSRFKAIYQKSNRVLLPEEPEASETRPVQGWAGIFLPWHVVPNRGQDFIERQKTERGLTDFEIEKEYPSSEEEALAPPRSAMYFDRDALMAQRRNIQEPETRLGGAVKVWRKPYVAGRYVAFGDNAWGEKGSYSCTTIMDWQTGDIMAEIHARMTLDELARLNVELCKEYNNAFIGVEANGEGIYVVNKMIELGYKNRMYHRDEDWQTEQRERGWWTDNTTRPVMLGEYEEAVRMGRVVERCQDSLNEHFSFIRNERGRPMHAEGAYDDHVMSRAGAWQMRKFARWTHSATGRRPSLPPVF